MKSNLRNENQVVHRAFRLARCRRSLTSFPRITAGATAFQLSNKLQRESLRYVEAVQLADALGYDLVWQKRAKP